MNKFTLLILAVIFSVYGAVSFVSTERTKLPQLIEQNNGIYQTSGWLKKTPNGIKVTNGSTSSTSIRVYGSTWQEGYGTVTISKEGDEYRLLSFEPRSKWQRVKETTNNYYITESGEKVPRGQAETKQVMFKGLYVK